MIGLISICLIIAAFYWILILSQRVKALEEKNNLIDQEGLSDQLEAYIDAVRAENTHLLKEVDSRLSRLSTPFEESGHLEVSEHLKATPAEPQQAEEIKLEPEKLDIGDVPDSPVDSLETSMLARILQLKQRGLTTEQIAKELGLGKGEVALMLKLHEKR